MLYRVYTEVHALYAIEIDAPDPLEALRLVQETKNLRDMELTTDDYENRVLWDLDDDDDRYQALHRQAVVQCPECLAPLHAMGLCKYCRLKDRANAERIATVVYGPEEEAC
jgi:hypothetical protein